MKRFIALFGLVGLVGCFLPLVVGVSFFELRDLEWTPVILVLAAFAVPMIAAATARTNGAVTLAGLAGFGYLVVKFGTGIWDMTIHAQIGGKMMAVAAAGGLISSLLALGERKRA